MLFVEKLGETRSTHGVNDKCKEFETGRARKHAWKR
jgi:hypothetical protein